ncbi:uncharacterized protein LOC111712550 isoform X4 [Eurytemora carolleeae]|uniref:uncharacterized protein LOC111712550 isoform X4 n=1 Tax=Eurytemora carolleeae TaxID=1294199 RepID=UPI000C788EC0|nr:uncharacterized protein LOC111712550 isoform X4 [Eurytemora carolleeae]|eukprot:XP_023342968.1 uncharacterized protein LOC111712550 isoform X4 [Eurytemora affinis]
MGSMTNQMSTLSVSGQPIRSELDSTTEESEEIYYSDESSSSKEWSLYEPVPFKPHCQDEEIISDWSSSDEDEQTGTKIYSVKPKNNSMSSLVVNGAPASTAPVSFPVLFPAPAPVSSVSRLRTPLERPRPCMDFYVSPRMSGYIGPPIAAAPASPTITNQEQRTVCICNRGTTVVCCTSCTKTFSKSRVKMECKVHPNRFMSNDLLKCSRCFSYLLEELQETM